MPASSSHSSGKRRPVKAVLFDLDGTLIEFKFKVRESRVAMVEWLEHQGFDTTGMSEKTKTQEILDSALAQCEARGRPDWERRANSVKQSLSNILDEFEFAAFDLARPHPGSLRVLKSLHESQLLTAIVTNSGRKPVDYLLRNLGYSPYLDLVLTRNEMRRLKPEPDGLLQAVAVLRVEKDEAMYVGDSVIDVEAARVAGITKVAVATGYYGESALRDSHPDYLIRSIEEVESIVGRK